jgi:uncharacterized protein YuzE
MVFEFDADANALDITLAEGISVRTVEIDTGTLVDVDEHGKPLSIEVLQPSRSWPLAEILERFEVDDDAARVLHALWRDDAPFPFAEPLRVAEPVA